MNSTKRAHSSTRKFFSKRGQRVLYLSLPLQNGGKNYGVKKWRPIELWIRWTTVHETCSPWKTKSAKINSSRRKSWVVRWPRRLQVTVYSLQRCSPSPLFFCTSKVQKSCQDSWYISKRATVWSFSWTESEITQSTWLCAPLWHSPCITLRSHVNAKPSLYSRRMTLWVTMSYNHSLFSTESWQWIQFV